MDSTGLKRKIYFHKRFFQHPHLEALQKDKGGIEQHTKPLNTSDAYRARHGLQIRAIGLKTVFWITIID